MERVHEEQGAGPDTGRGQIEKRGGYDTAMERV